MALPSFRAFSLALGTVISPLLAQPEIGSAAPEVEFKQSWNGQLTSLGALRGKLVMLDLFATW